VAKGGAIKARRAGPIHAMLKPRTSCQIKNRCRLCRIGVREAPGGHIESA